MNRPQSGLLSERRTGLLSERRLQREIRLNGHNTLQVSMIERQKSVGAVVQSRTYEITSVDSYMPGLTQPKLELDSSIAPQEILLRAGDKTSRKGRCCAAIRACPQADGPR